MLSWFTKNGKSFKTVEYLQAEREGKKYEICVTDNRFFILLVM